MTAKELSVGDWFTFKGNDEDIYLCAKSPLEIKYVINLNTGIFRLLDLYEILEINFVSKINHQNNMASGDYDFKDLKRGTWFADELISSYRAKNVYIKISDDIKICIQDYVDPNLNGMIVFSKNDDFINKKHIADTYMLKIQEIDKL